MRNLELFFALENFKSVLQELFKDTTGKTGGEKERQSQF